MRPRFEPSPDRTFLTEGPLHVVVLRYPETLSILREAGVDLAREGGQGLSARKSVPPGLVRALQEATAWRPDAPREG